MSSTHGNDPGISTLNPNQVQIVAKAQFADACCWVGPRTYFYVYENSVEANKPYYNCCYPNCICWEFDNIWKMYFDRGIWDMRSCMYKIGCLAGPATFYSNNPKHVCCCMDCCECYNDYVACHCACCCNDRIYYTPCDSFCCGLCSTRATACTNYCGLCGPKTGEPIMAINFIAGLLVGSGESLSIAINNARHTWSARTLKV